MLVISMECTMLAIHMDIQLLNIEPKKCRNNKMSGGKLQRGLICHNCNKMGNIAKKFKNIIEKSNSLERKIDINNEKEKMKMK